MSPIDDATDPSETIARLEAELVIALESAEAAETGRGLLEGELVEARNNWAAANLTQQEWDRLLAEQLEELRRCRERCETLEAEHAGVVDSTTWQVAQRLLAPLRWVRARRG